MAACSPVVCHSDWINSVALSPDRRRLATVSNDCTVRVWSSVSCELEATLGTHTAAATSVVFLSNNTVASTGMDDKV